MDKIKQMEILKFRSSPRGYYYGGEEHFKEEVAKYYTESYTDSALKMGCEFPEGTALLPVVIHMLLDDNTGLITMQYPESKEQKNAIADAIRAFMGDHQRVLKESLNIEGKVVAIAICMEMWFRSIPVAGLSEEQIKEAIKNRMQNKELVAVSGISIDFQFPDATKNTVLMFKTNPATGEVSPYKDVTIANNLRKDTIWSEMFTRKLEGKHDENFISPEKATQFVSRIIKQAVETSKEFGKTTPVTEEEKGAWSTTFGQSIDISDLFKSSEKDKQ